MVALLILLCCHAIFPSLSAFGNNDCDNCRHVAKTFISGIYKSAGKNFGGGNSLWEERHLGSYSVSEARYHDILDGMCDVKEKIECHKFLENIEHFLEDWWLSDFRMNTNNPERLEEELCITRTELCCPAAYFGPLCHPCPTCYAPGGTCDGNGTRFGTGRCICIDGYTGEACDHCNLGTHFPSLSNGSSLACQRCHSSCSGGCSGPFPQNCSSCATGWTALNSTDQQGCIDVDECVGKPCNSDTHFCLNKPGSYECIPCHSACRGCTGATSNDCTFCASGYHRGSGEACEDIDECNADSNICNGEGEICKNMIGGYKCDCKKEYKRINNVCVLTARPDSSSETLGKFEKQPETDKFNSHNRYFPKIIWTVSYTKEFLKYCASLIAFGFLCWFAKGHLFTVAFASLLMSIYVYFQSITFDSIFAHQK
ncbi:unnamed protein product [Heterobilharzia americana]|nr:unnamed protein product [Heterobilharzia americana]